MAFAVTVVYDDVLTGGSDNSQHSEWMYGTITVGAGTYVTGGTAIVWGVNDYPKVSNLVPKDVYIYSAGLVGTTVGGFGYMWNKAANKFQIGASVTVANGTGPQTVEMTNGTTIPTNVTGDTIRFEARFIKAHSGF